MRQDHELLLDEFNPDDRGRASSSAIFATYLTATPTGINLDISPSGPPANATQPSSSSKESTKKLRGRRRSNLEMHKASERREVPRPVSMELGCETAAPENAVGVEGLIQESGRRILATSSRADQGTEAVGDAKDRIDLKGFGARVEGAQRTRAQGLEGRRHSDATLAAADGVNQVEARTPPAMERNLFLSALANGKLEVIKCSSRCNQRHVGAITPRVRCLNSRRRGRAIQTSCLEVECYLELWDARPLKSGVSYSFTE